MTFTSLRDNSAAAGGDGWGLDNAAPAPGDWSGINVNGGGIGVLERVNVRYASTALDVGDNAILDISGSILDSTMGIRSPQSYVDATDVDWGRPSGPAPIGSGTPIDGPAILVTPWGGYVMPPVPPPPPPQPEPEPADCALVYFLGVRGSGEAPQGNSGYSSNETTNMGSKVGQVFEQFRREVEGRTAAGTPEGRGHRYAAANVRSLLSVTESNYFNSIWDGVSWLKNKIRAENAACGRLGQKIVLAGYSQGALVVHLALEGLAGTNAGDAVDAVVLVADPALAPGGGETRRGDAADHARGVYARIDSNTAPIPTEFTGKTISIC